ncbi:MFS transporter [Taibaiella koreensis]|uniref:MFS transporter n=1 Tax=Taibaiella koreensis TaxID=1268548 RepID=UPI000E59C6E3|nr:MFS transporter [Taibaiella koreensis]
MQSERSGSRNVVLLVLVAALGYFVDIYDLLIFSIVRVQSLSDIGVAPENSRRLGEFVINVQMAGLLLGGILWGIVGDKFGRIRVLFGSILVYSIANVINGFVQDVNTYALIRFIAGIGLAGELGAGITLVSETMSKEKRGYGTMLVAVIGLFGAVAANLVAHNFSWRTAYFVGGGLGFVLLLLRVGTFESGMYRHVEGSTVRRGSFRMLFSNRQRALKYLYCILIGIPLWFVVGILIAQSPEFGKALGAKEALTAGGGIMYSYIGISIGDIFAGLLAQWARSRRLAILIFLVLSLGTVIWYLNSKGIDARNFHILAFIMGLGVGYWATFVTIASEQFGTNLRATVTTTVPNFVRGSLIPITFIFDFFVERSNIITAGYIVMFGLTAVSLFALSRLKETFGKDLDYLEE